MRTATVLKGAASSRADTGKNKSGFSRWGEPLAPSWWSWKGRRQRARPQGL